MSVDPIDTKPAPPDGHTAVYFSIYRFNPEKDKKPFMQDYTLYLPEKTDIMLLAALKLLKKQDETLSFRHSCGEGVCGSDGININGKNGLACITPLSSLKTNLKTKKIELRPLPGLPVIRDLVVDMTLFYDSYKKIKPYLINHNLAPAKERLQSPEDRAKLDGLYECILCACCSTGCPSYWWKPDKFLGPAALLAAYRFIIDSRDTAKKERLEALSDLYSVYACHNIMNCGNVCPKNLNPTKAIGKIRTELIKEQL